MFLPKTITDHIEEHSRYSELVDTIVSKGPTSEMMGELETLLGSIRQNHSKEISGAYQHLYNSIIRMYGRGELKCKS